MSPGLPRSDAPLIVQSDGSVLLETAAPDAAAARDAMSRFAEIVKSPEHVHTYRLSSLSLWQAAGQGMTADDVVGALERFSKYALPANVVHEIRSAMGRFGRLVLEKAGESLVLRAADGQAAAEIAAFSCGDSKRLRRSGSRCSPSCTSTFSSSARSR